jgi:hypothetical protein
MKTIEDETVTQKPTRARPDSPTPAWIVTRQTTHGDVARRAHEIFCEGGSEHGHDLENWLQAEGELLGVRHVASAQG